MKMRRDQASGGGEGGLLMILTGGCKTVTNIRLNSRVTTIAVAFSGIPGSDDTMEIALCPEEDIWQMHGWSSP